MDGLNWLVLELLWEQEMRRGRSPLPRRPVPPNRPREGSSVKRALAAALVRLGLRLDPAAGEGLGALSLPLARPEARRQA